MKQTTGFIVAIDGPDGSGKTTQIRLLADALTKQGYEVHLTRASGGTPIGEELRKASHSNNERSAEVDLYISLAMHTALGQDIQKRKAQGQIVLVDRSPLAIIAYQNYGSQLKDQQAGYDAYEKMLRLWNIDLLLVFDINEAVLAKRDEKRKLTNPDETINYFEKRGEDYKHRVHEGYKAAVSYLNKLDGLGTKVTIIDASGTEAAIQDSIQKLVTSAL